MEQVTINLWNKIKKSESDKNTDQFCNDADLFHKSNIEDVRIGIDRPSGSILEDDLFSLPVTNKDLKLDLFYHELRVHVDQKRQIPTKM